MNDNSKTPTILYIGRFTREKLFLARTRKNENSLMARVREARSVSSSC